MQEFVCNFYRRSFIFWSVHVIRENTRVYIQINLLTVHGRLKLIFWNETCKKIVKVIINIFNQLGYNYFFFGLLKQEISQTDMMTLVSEIITYILTSFIYLVAHWFVIC